MPEIAEGEANGVYSFCLSFGLGKKSTSVLSMVMSGGVIQPRSLLLGGGASHDLVPKARTEDCVYWATVGSVVPLELSRPLVHGDSFWSCVLAALVR